MIVTKSMIDEKLLQRAMTNGTPTADAFIKIMMNRLQEVENKKLINKK